MTGDNYRAGAKVDRTPVRAERMAGNAIDTLALGNVGVLTEAQVHAARRNLAAFALERPDPAGWLADMLSILGLDGRPARVVGRCGTCRKPIGNRGTNANRRGYCTERCLRESWT